MYPSEDMVQVINRVRYRVKGSTLLAHDHYFNGSNFEQHGRNTFLYRSPHGRYFAVHLSQWQGEDDAIEPMDADAAYELYESLREKEVPPEEAFPNVEIAEA